LALRGLNGQIDSHLAGVIEKCLALDPVKRFQSAGELAAALRECGRPEYRARRWLLRHPRRLAATLAGVILAVSAVFAVAAAVRRPAHERHRQQGIQALEASRYEQAVDFLSRALVEENSFRGHMARARAYQR
jgi:hypothetical protein